MYESSPPLVCRSGVAAVCRGSFGENASMRSLLLTALTLAVVGCANQAPVFPDLGGELSNAEVVQTLRARTDLDSFYAVLSIDFESPERDGTFDVVIPPPASAQGRDKDDGADLTLHASRTTGGVREGDRGTGGRSDPAAAR